MNTARSAALLVSLTLGGCATSHSPPAGVSDQQALLAPRLACAVLTPNAGVKDVNVVQDIVVHVRGQTIGFQAQIQINGGEIDLVALDSLGRRGMTVKWSGDTLSATRAPWLPDFVRPADILTDIAIVYWPADAIALPLAKCGAKLTETVRGRSVTSGPNQLLRVSFEDGEGWNRAAHLHNTMFGFDIDIQSAVLQ